MSIHVFTLRPFEEQDKQRILQILTDRTVGQTYMLPDFEQEEDAIPLFHRLMALSLDGSRYVRCIDLEGTAIGFVNDVQIEGDSIELGYVIHPNEQGRGYMTQALKIAIREILKMGYREVLCGAFETNRASIRVMEKCGMKLLEKTETISYRGREHRCVYYGYEKR